MALAGDLLVPAACCDDLQGTGTGQCLWDIVPCDERMWHPLFPTLYVARTGTAVSQPPFSLWSTVSGVLGSWKGGGLCVVSCTLPTASPL